MITDIRTFRKAMGMSIAVHIAIFGSAIAFAYYGGVLYQQSLWSMTVSLVGPGVSTGTSGKPGRELLEERSAADITSANGNHMPAVENEPGGSEQRPISMGDPTGVVDEQGRAPGTGGQSGGVIAVGYSPEEWMRFSTALERVKRYPRLARERGIEGTVLVRFKVQPTGGIERVDIVKSSGAKILDDASVSTVYRAAPVPYVDGWVEVPMVYQLDRPEFR
ncbi:MAG: energy transducer TonB [Nitrospirota bacterium]